MTVQFFLSSIGARSYDGRFMAWFALTAGKHLMKAAYMTYFLPAWGSGSDFQMTTAKCCMYRCLQ